MPTDPKTACAHSKSAWVACVPPAIPEAPCPTRAGVLGIARTTATPAPQADSRVFIVTPAAIDKSLVAPAPTQALAATGTSGGFTAMTAEPHGPIVAEIVTPGKSCAKCWRRASRTSTIIRSLGVTKPDDNKPPASAAPIFPPPTMAKIAESEVPMLSR